MTSLHLGFINSKKVDVVLQSEAAECGLACLTMVANYLGHTVDLRYMRARFAISSKGMTLKTMIDISANIGISSRPIRIELIDLKLLGFPCILHWNLNHFVVLTRASSRFLEIIDPAIGRRRVTLNDADSQFTGVVLECAKASGFTAINEARQVSIRLLMGRIVGIRMAFTQLLILALVLEVLALIGPFYMQWITDHAILAGDKSLAILLAIGFGALLLMQVAVSTLRSWLTTSISTNLNFQWLNNTFGHLMSLRLPFFERRQLSDIVSRFASIDIIQRSLTAQFVESVADGLLAIATLSLMCFYSPLLAGLSVTATMIYFFIRILITRALVNLSAEQLVHQSHQQNFFLETVRGIQSVKIFQAGNTRRIGWANLLTRQLNAQLGIARIMLALRAASQLIIGLERLIVVSMAAIMTIDGHLSLGMMLAFIGYKEQFIQRMTTLIEKTLDFRTLGVQAQRVADIVEEPAEIMDLADWFEEFKSIEFKNVSYRFSNDSEFIVKDVNFVIRANEFVAFTGPSGCGKTTILKLLIGLIKPSSGAILLNGSDLAVIGPNSIRRLVGAVMQDDVLFSGSIEDNVAFFDPNPNKLRIEECSRLAAIFEDVLRMPMKFGTLVGEIGSTLSGGQRQRLLLARALYRDPSLLVLDEATSNLDTTNEQRINSALKALSLTRIIVAHSPETIAAADRIIELNAGTVISDRAT